MERIDTSKPPSPAQLRELWEQCDKALLEDRRNYWLNLSFLLGQQWVEWKAETRTVELLPDEQVRKLTTINQCGPAVDGLLGRLLKRDLSFEVQASDSDDVAQRGGKLTEYILEHDRRYEGWEDEREEELLGVLMGGTSAVCVEWDPEMGDVVAKSPGDGSDLHLGGCRLTGLSIADFSLQPYTRRQRDALWWMKATTLTPEQAFEAYNLAKMPEPDGVLRMSALQSRLLSKDEAASSAETCTVLTMYHRPSRRTPKGYVTASIGDDVVAEVGTWPFPFERLNLYAFRQLKGTKRRWTGTTFMSQIRGPQFHYNMVRSVALDHADKVSNARLMVPEGWVDDPDDAFTNEAGDMVVYHPMEGEKAYWEDPPSYERQLANEADRIKSEIADIVHSHATSQGEMVGDRNSGLALSLVAEKDDSPLGVMARDQATGWGQIAGMVAQIYEANAIETRSVRVVSANKVTIKREWTGADIHGQTDVVVPLDATTPHSKVAHQAVMTNMAAQFPQMFQGIPPTVMARILDLPNMDMIPGILDPDMKRASWENEMLAEGRPCVPDPWHDHAKHIAEHNAQRNDPSFEMWPEANRELMAKHITAHENMAAEEIANQARLEQAGPGLSQLPQGDNPPGSAVPPPLALIQGGQGNGQPQPPQPPAPGGQPPNQEQTG